MQITGVVVAPGDPADGRPQPVAVNPDGSLQVQQTAAPATSAATTVATTQTTVGTSAAALSGTSPTGWTLLNASASGQTIYLGPAGVTTATGFTLPAGAALDRANWQDLSIVYAIASAAGADLRGVAL